MLPKTFPRSDGLADTTQTAQTAQTDHVALPNKHTHTHTSHLASILQQSSAEVVALAPSTTGARWTERDLGGSYRAHAEFGSPTRPLFLPLRQYL